MADDQSVPADDKSDDDAEKAEVMKRLREFEAAAIAAATDLASMQAKGK